MIGTKLAHYEITSHLGTGGMGEVYQATDSKLGRSVAIKLLPEAFTHDHDRVARFEREARVLASLNHSNIASIYGIEESGGRKFLVMELVRGETLEERIKRGAIPVNEALAIAKEIAEGLVAAHGKGIIHRDLKPANVKIAPDGKVKVLDFGLAKAFSGESVNSSLSNSPTIGIAATQAGMILGTAAYMSPEQAKGQEVDHRTDIFAFGCVLYEMLTGRQTFPGEGVSDILASVLKSEPDWKCLPADTPAAVRRVLQRCLRKDRNRRFQTIGDARIEIDEAGSEPEEMGPGATPAVTQRREILKWIAAGGAAVAAGDVLERLYFSKPAVEPEMRTSEIVTPPTPEPMSFALSPDGRRLVFVASQEKQSQLWLCSLRTGAQQPLAGTERASFPFWKPDSASVAFFADHKLKRIDIDTNGGGGSAQTLLNNVILSRGGAWSSDGFILFSPGTENPLFRVSDSPGGSAIPVTKLDLGHLSHRFPCFLPGGRQFLFHVRAVADKQGIYLGSLDPPKTQLVLPSETAGAFLPSGWLLFVFPKTLMSQRFDPEKGNTIGEPVKIGTPVGSDSAVGCGAFSVSATGLIAYRSAAASERQLIWFDEHEKSLGTFGPRDPNSMSGPAISPDGSRVAVTRVIEGNEDVWILDPHPQPFTSAKSSDNFPVWSPLDGKWIVFRSNGRSALDLYVKPSRDEGDETLLVESQDVKVPCDWYGSSLLYYKVDKPTGLRSLFVQQVTEDAKRDGETKELLNNNPNKDWHEFNGQFSPDGLFVAYQSNESKEYEINVVRLLGKARPRQVSIGGGIWPRWSPDGKKLYYLRLDGMLVAVSLTVNGAVMEPGATQELFQPRIVSSNLSVRWQYDVARKGDRKGQFLINAPVEDAVTSPITLVQNWKP